MPAPNQGRRVARDVVSLEEDGIDNGFFIEI
jgi:hypothetical protein